MLSMPQAEASSGLSLSEAILLPLHPLLMVEFILDQTICIFMPSLPTAVKSFGGLLQTMPLPLRQRWLRASSMLVPLIPTSTPLTPLLVNSSGPHRPTTRSIPLQRLRTESFILAPGMVWSTPVMPLLARSSGLVTPVTMSSPRLQLSMVSSISLPGLVKSTPFTYLEPLLDRVCNRDH